MESVEIKYEGKVIVKPPPLRIVHPKFTFWQRLMWAFFEIIPKEHPVVIKARR